MRELLKKCNDDMKSTPQDQKESSGSEASPSSVRPRKGLNRFWLGKGVSMEGKILAEGKIMEESANEHL